MSTQFTSLPNWLRGFDSRHPLHASSQVTSGLAVRFDGGTGDGCTRECTQLAHGAGSSSRRVSPQVKASPAGMTSELLKIAARRPAASWSFEDAPVEGPLPSEPEREWVWREGYGWVQPSPVVEPVESPAEWPAAGWAA
jgi:hypothetical protein